MLSDRRRAVDREASGHDLILRAEGRDDGPQDDGQRARA
jgi:hypothetical protein